MWWKKPKIEIPKQQEFKELIIKEEELFPKEEKEEEEKPKYKKARRIESFNVFQVNLQPFYDLYAFMGRDLREEPDPITVVKLYGEYDKPEVKVKHNDYVIKIDTVTFIVVSEEELEKNWEVIDEEE